MSGRGTYITPIREESNSILGRLAIDPSAAVAGRSSAMELAEEYRGFEVGRTSAGHLVVLDPCDCRGERLELVKALARSNVLDKLFFPTIDDAHRAIDWLIDHDAVHF